MALEISLVPVGRAARPTLHAQAFMHVLLAPLGSAGDVHPFAGLGSLLRSRGHRVTLLGDRQFGGLVEAAGLEFVPLEKGRLDRPQSSSVMELVGRAAESGLRLFCRRLRKLARASVVLPYIQPLYEAIARHQVPGHTVVVASSLALGARVAQEKLGVPLVTMHLSPCQLRSAHRSPLLPVAVMPPWLPVAAKRVAYRLLDALVFDRLLGDLLNGFRQRLGLPKVRRVFDAWRHSPARTIGLFPDWFGMPQPDWPAQVRLTGFPLYDGGNNCEPLPPQVQDFLDAGAPPLVFTPSTSIGTVRQFFVESVKASQLLGRRALLLTRFGEQVPGPLPVDVRHFAYVPFSQLLQRARALIHFGGIGSASQALAAGIPQLVVPFKNDQFDNAARLRELHVARVLSFRAYRGPTVARCLQTLLQSERVAGHCRLLSARLQSGHALEQTCQLIEEVHQSHLGQVANLPAHRAG